VAQSATTQATSFAPAQADAGTAAPTSTPAAAAATGDATVSAAESGSATRSSALQAEPLPLYQNYVVQPGDTVSGIAARSGGRTRDIIATNSGVISDQSMLVVGASLQVPSAPGILHNVSVGETLEDIASEYGVTVDDIVSYPGNRISDPSNVIEGAQILIVN